MRIGLKIFASALLLAVIPAKSFAADSGLQPSFSLSEEYNDNIFGSERNGIEDYITRVLPGLAGFYNTSRLDLSASYAFDYRYFAKQRQKNEKTHKLGLNAKAELLKNRFFLNLSDTYDKVSLDPARDRSRESLFLGQTDSNVFTAEPYFVFRPGQLVSVTTGYRYVNTWYKEENTADRRDNIYFLKADLEASPSSIWTLGYGRTEERSRSTDFDKDDIYLGYTHEYGQGSNIFFRVGNTKLDFESGKSYNSIYWNAGVGHDFNHFQVNFATSARMNENPLSTPQWEYLYSIGISRKFQRTDLSLALSLNEFENSETEELETMKYGVDFNVRYEITPKLNYAISANAEKFELRTQSTFTRKYLMTHALDYVISKDLSIAFTYILVNYHSPVLLTDNYTTNRIIAELRKTF